jgi:hypothetical protein
MKLSNRRSRSSRVKNAFQQGFLKNPDFYTKFERDFVQTSYKNLDF